MLRAPERKEKQRRRRASAWLNQVRRVVTIEVTLLVRSKAGVHKAYPAEESGQLRFPGSMIAGRFPAPFGVPSLIPRLPIPRPLGRGNSSGGGFTQSTRLLGACLQSAVCSLQSEAGALQAVLVIWSLGTLPLARWPQIVGYRGISGLLCGVIAMLGVEAKRKPGRRPVVFVLPGSFTWLAGALPMPRFVTCIFTAGVQAPLR